MDNNNKQTQDERLKDLLELFEAVTYKRKAHETVTRLQDTTVANATPEDIVILVHQIVERGYPMSDTKVGISRILNVLRQTIDSFPYTKPKSGTFFDICIRNNEEILRRLNSVRPHVHKLNKQNISQSDKEIIINLLQNLKKVTDYYLIKENIIFPLAEENLDDYRCIAVMWSIHDDIRRNLNNLIDLLSAQEHNLEQANRLIGDIFFDINAIVFREEKLLYPFIEQQIPHHTIEALWNESVESGFPYYNPEKRKDTSTENNIQSNLVDLKTGELSAEQLLLVFNHLPVDITFVDEHDRVRFFSTPKERIFHRTNAVIGRNVHNCHPKESVHVVDKIVKSFREGTKDKADFWISMRNGKRVLIQYFALRNEQGEYKGVIEVTQEISEIQKLEGDKRILDWED